VGLVGANGSGKTTLLKVLNRVMYPTVGRVRVTGRVGALIALSASIHPNLTGRENITLTGSLMGLRRRQVAERFDEIVAFAELEHAIDRQAKYYSSGMQMRLGFGVAAFLEPSVLLVDEVLAVGDASFQQRCLDRMRQVLGLGTTLVFVSHDLAAVEATCTRGVWLDEGVIRADGPVRDVLSSYRADVEADAHTSSRRDGRVALTRVGMKSSDGGLPRSNAPLDIDFTFESADQYRAWVYVGVSEGTAAPIFLLNPGRETLLGPGETKLHCSISELPLPRGRFYLWAAVYERRTDGPELLAWQPVTHFDVYGPDLDRAPTAVVRLAPLSVASSWSLEDA
jgi:ABC-2 type transport system ATP-binding protein